MSQRERATGALCVSVCRESGVSLSCQAASTWSLCSLPGGVMPGSWAVLASPAETPEWSGQEAEASSSESQGCLLWAESPGCPEGLGFSRVQTLDFPGTSFLVRNEDHGLDHWGSRGGGWGSPGLRFLGLWPLLSPKEGQSLCRPLPAITILGHKF